MPEAHSQAGRRKLASIDSRLERAIDGLYEYYYMLLRADLGLAALVECMMVDITQTRRDLKALYEACWETTDKRFDSIDELPNHIAQARMDVLERKGMCQAYLHVLDRSRRQLSRLSEVKRSASLKQLGS